MTDTKYAIIYTRVSDQNQVNKGHSIEEQEPMLRKFAENEGYIIKKVFTDSAKSATSMVGRDEMYRALAYLQEDKTISAIIVQDTDRIARNEQDHFAIRSVLSKHNVKLVSKNQPGINDSPEGKLVDGIMASVNAFQSRITGRKVSDMFQQLVEKGKTLYRPPTGYINVNTGTDEKPVKTVEIEPENSKLIQQAFRLYGTGNYSILELNEIMYEKGLRSPHGGKFEPSGLAKLLVNPYYIGKIKHKGKLYDGIHPKLIDDKLYQKCLSIVQDHNQYAIRKRIVENHKKFFLRGILKCGICGGSVTGSHVQNKNCDYYYCSIKKFDKNFHSNKGQTADIKEIEGQVYEFFKLFKLTPEITEEVLNRAKEILSETHSDIDDMKKRLSLGNITLERQRQALEIKLLNGVISDETYTRQHARLDEEIFKNTQEITKIDIKRIDNTKIFEGLVRLADDVPHAYKISPPEVKMMYLNIFWDHFDIKDREVSKAVPSNAVSALLNEKLIKLKANTPAQKVLISKLWWAVEDSNLWPCRRQRHALPTELTARSEESDRKLAFIFIFRTRESIDEVDTAPIPPRIPPNIAKAVYLQSLCGQTQESKTLAIIHKTIYNIPTKNIIKFKSTNNGR